MSQQNPSPVSRNLLKKSNSTYCDVRLVACLDPDSDLFMRVAQHAYKDHLDNLVPCSKCKRKFFPDRIERHEETCAADPVRLNSDNSKKKDLKKLPRKVASTTGAGSSYHIRVPPQPHSSKKLLEKTTKELTKSEKSKQ